MTSRSYGGYIMIDTPMENNISPSRNYHSSGDTDYVLKAKSISTRRDHGMDASTPRTEDRSVKRSANIPHRDATPDKYSHDVKQPIESNPGHKTQASVHNNDKSRKHASRTSENDLKAHNNTTPRKGSSNQYENGTSERSNGTSQRLPSRHYGEEVTSTTNDLSRRSLPRQYKEHATNHSASTSQRYSSRHYEHSNTDQPNESSRRRSSRHYDDKVTDASKQTQQRRSSRHYDDKVTDASKQTQQRRSSRHYEDNVTEASKETHQRPSSRHYENAHREHSNGRSQRRHSRQQEDGNTDHSNDSSRSRSSKHHEDDITDRSSSSRRRSLSHYEHDVTSRNTDSSRKYSARHYEQQYKNDLPVQTHKFVSPRAHQTSDRSGYSTLPSSTKLSNSERRDSSLHDRVTDRADMRMGVSLHGNTTAISDTRVDHGFRPLEYDSYGSSTRNGEDAQLHTRSLHRRSLNKDQAIPNSEQLHDRRVSRERVERRGNHHHPQDVGRNCSQHSAMEPDSVSDRHSVGYHSSKQSQIHNNAKTGDDIADMKNLTDGLPDENDTDLSHPYNHNSSDDRKKRTSYKYREERVARSTSQNFVEESETSDRYVRSNDTYSKARKRSSSATRNNGRNGEASSDGTYSSISISRSKVRSSRDKLDNKGEDTLFRLAQPQDPGHVNKSKHFSGSEQDLNMSIKHAHKNGYSRVQRDTTTNGAGGRVLSSPTNSKSRGVAIDMYLAEERKPQNSSPYSRQTLEPGRMVNGDDLDSSLGDAITGNYSHVATESTVRSRVSSSRNRKSSASDKHEEVNGSSYKHDVCYSRRSSSARSNDNAGFVSSSSPPRTKDSQHKLSRDAASLTPEQDKYHRSRVESRQHRKSPRETNTDRDVSLARNELTQEERYTELTHNSLTTTQGYINGDFHGSKKSISTSNSLLTNTERGESAELDSVFLNSETKKNITKSAENSPASVAQNDSPKSASKGDVEVSSSTSTLKDSCVTSKASISDSISSLLGRGNKYQQFRSIHSEAPSVPGSISDKWRKLTRTILPDKDATSENSKERKAPAIFYAAAARFMNTLAGVQNALPKGSNSPATQAVNGITSSHLPQNVSPALETQVEERKSSEVKSEFNSSPHNTLSLLENPDKVSPSHSIVSLEVPNAVTSERPSIISTAGNLSNHKMRMSAYVLMTEKTDLQESESDKYMSPLNFDSDMKRRSKDAVMELTSFLPAEMSRREEKFHEAARVNDSDSIRALLKEKVNINCRNSLDRTALHWAAANGSLEVAEILIEHGAHLEAKDKYGMRPVLWAAWFGHVSVLKVLINAGANTRVTNKQGLGILHCAAENNHIAVISFIFEALENYDVNLRDKNERTPLHSAAEAGHVEAVSKLLEAKADVHKKDKAGMTAVHLAVKCGHTEVLKALLLQGYEVDDRDVDGKTALHLAAEGGHKDAVDLLLDYTANPNSETVKEVTPLHLAAQEGHVEVCRSLVKYGLNVNAQNSQGNSALHIAANGNHKEVARILIDAKCELDLPNNRMQTPLHIAVESGHLDVVQVLLAGGASLDTREKSGKSALQLAARGNYVAVVDMLIKAERYYANAREYHDKDVGYVDPDTYLRNPQHPHAAQMKDVLWKLATKQLKPNDWKKLAYHWRFTPEHVKAIEQEYTGTSSYKEHSYRLLNIWLHGVRKDENVLKLLFEALVAIDRKHLAESVRRKVNLQAEKPCSPSLCIVS